MSVEFEIKPAGNASRFVYPAADFEIPVSVVINANGQNEVNVSIPQIAYKDGSILGNAVNNLKLTFIQSGSGGVIGNAVADTMSNGWRTVGVNTHQIQITAHFIDIYGGELGVVAFGRFWVLCQPQTISVPVVTDTVQARFQYVKTLRFYAQELAQYIDAC